ncbi:MAG: ATP-binding protein [Candidatus Dadabacteria bacterium]|nr:MAG: ATP-binding protein [Candidatus Dadabacteria bacterium]
MYIYDRILNISRILEQRSVFLFGPRQTGKTTYLKKYYPDSVYYNLLEADVFRDLSLRPELIRQRLRGTEKIIIIDEVQKLPVLLDEVHLLIESHKNLRFILTGSSARKLKRGGVNTLAGRAWKVPFYPLVSKELNYERLDDRLATGSLPAVINSASPWDDLKEYVGTYLREEIQAEGFIRSIEKFSRFLDVAALCNGAQVNFNKVGSDAGVPARTVREYFQILVDTLVAYRLEPYRKTSKRKPVATSKFYLFDTGVANYLMKRKSVMAGSPEYGAALEHLIILELKAYLDYNRIDLPLNYWRSTTKLEVDAVIGEELAIEIKASERISERDLKGLRALSEEVSFKRSIVICRESAPRTTEDGIEIIPVNSFFRMLWEGELI